MADSVLVLIADEKYLPYARNLFTAAVGAGNWQGDLLLLTNDGAIAPFEVAGRQVLIMKVSDIEAEDFSWSTYNPIVLNKLYLFEEVMKRWDHIVYMDCDITIHGDIAALSRASAFSAAPYKSYRLSDCFLNKDRPAYKELEKEFDLDVVPLNSGVVAFPSSIIGPDTFKNLVALYSRYKTVVYGDDEILNLFFYKKWQRLKITYNFDKEHYRSILNPQQPPRVLHHIHDKDWQSLTGDVYGSATPWQDLVYEWRAALLYACYVFRRMKDFTARYSLLDMAKLAVFTGMARLLARYGYDVVKRKKTS